MVFVINLPQQLLRQRQDHIKCRQFPGLRNAAGDLAEIVKLDFQRQRIPPEVLMLQTGYQFHRSMIQLDNDRRPPVDILLQSMFTPHRLTNAHRFYRTKIYPARKIIIDVPHLTKLAQQHRLRTGTQLPTGMYPQNMHLPCRHRTHSPETLYRQMCYKIQSLVGMNGTQTVGFTVIGCYLGKKLIVGNSGRGHQTQPLAHFPFYFSGYIHSQKNTRLIFRHIQKRLIQRDRFYDIRIFMEYLMNLTGHRFIDVHTPRNKNKLRTQPFCLL